MDARKSATIVVGVIAAVAVAAAAMVGVQQLNASQVRAATPPPLTTSSAPTTPAPSPTPTATEPPVREAVIDDATVEDRISAPRTGEIWTTPTPAPDVASVLAQGHDTWKPYLVGHRGAAKIYVVVDDVPGVYRWLSVAMIAEVDASGARQISCPSARTSDACVASAGAPGVTLDAATFYDSLTLPASIEVGPGWRLDTSLVRRAPSYGDGLALAVHADESFSWRDYWRYTPVTNVGGGLRVVEMAVAQPGSIDVRSYVLVLPTGLTVELDPQAVPGGDFEAIRWDDGVVRTEDPAFGAFSYAGSGVGCVLGQYSVQQNFDLSQWSRAGNTREGAAVYVPTSANPLVHTVRAAELDARQWRIDAAGYPNAGEQRAYPFASDAAFRDAHALYAIAGPDGGWQIRLRGDAVVRAWECE